MQIKQQKMFQAVLSNRNIHECKNRLQQQQNPNTIMHSNRILSKKETTAKQNQKRNLAVCI